jgi:hypothetical protein
VHDHFLLLEVITFAIISFLVVLFLEVLLFAMRVVGASIIAMASVVLVFVAVALVALMVVTVLATMMPVVQTTAASDRKMSRFLLLWLFLFIELVKDTGHFVGNLALLKKATSQKGSMGIVSFVSANLN